jgi:hypothetical protein
VLVGTVGRKPVNFGIDEKPSKFNPNFDKYRHTVGEDHDQGDAKWIVIRGQLRGHNDAPLGRPTPGRPILATQGVIGVPSYYVTIN